MPRQSKRSREDEELARRERDRQAQVVARIEDLDADGLRRAIDALAAKWIRPRDQYVDLVTSTFDNFGLGVDIDFSDPASYGLRQLDERIHDHEMEVIAVYHRCRTLNVDDDRIVRCIEQVYYGKKLVLSVFQSRLASASADDPLTLDADLDARLGNWSLRFRWIDDEDTNNLQKLLLYMLDQALEKQYRRQGSHVYEPIVVDGHKTHAWRQVMDIKTWVHSECRKETAWQQWTWLTAGKNASSTVEYLTVCQDYSFPSLVKSRSVFAFRNGVYLADRDEFKVFGAPGYDVPNDVVAAKFFDLDVDPDVVDPDTDARSIPTPLLDRVQDFQGFEPAVKDWMCVMLGRLLYDVNARDRWQVIPFFKGQASSGKSTLVLSVAKQFYEDIDVGTLSNNVEKKFGLSAFVDKFLFVAPEIKSDLKLEQAEFQQLVSGESMTINTKYQTAYAKDWRVPGVLAGNEVPDWCDNAASIQRRVLLWDFVNQVTAGDSRLGEKLAREIPNILVKCNKMYLDAVRQYADANIWTVLPDYFKGTRDAVAQQTNVVEGFLGSGAVVFEAAKFCPMEEFKLALKAWCQQNNYRAVKLTWDVFRGPLEKYRITKKRETLEYQGRVMTRDFLHGVDLAAAADGGVL